MKLRNKKTGEIIDIYKGEITLHYNQGRKTIHFKHLEDLEEWEDYEEPKEYWYIECDGEVYSIERLIGYDSNKLKEIGNYFESREEAEKAVEKLKAAKRLKDKGFRFDKWINVTAGPYMPIWFYFEEDIALEDVKSDLDLLFSGGEE